MRIGAVGVGRFGLFALENFTAVDSVSVVAATSSDPSELATAAERFGASAMTDVDELVRRRDVDLVYISTPPFLHHPQAMRALEAGKHVICEKPLALSLDEADEMVSLAQSSGLLLVANLIQRYSPLFGAVGTVIRSKVLGDLVHASFHNDASDEHLDGVHWFWDEAKSGGIFVEHGVHFFDLFDGWLGEGEVVAAQRLFRADSGFEEQAVCTVRHAGGVLAQHYHGFTRPARMESQELRLTFELGQLTLYGWIPTGFDLDAVVDESGLQRLHKIFPAERISITDTYRGSHRQIVSRQQRREVDHTIHLEGDQPIDKYERYGEMVRSLLSDQISWIRDRKHRRTISAKESRDSLVTALGATRVATHLRVS